jgi:hypothetical protein
VRVGESSRVRSPIPSDRPRSASASSSAKIALSNSILPQPGPRRTARPVVSHLDVHRRCTTRTISPLSDASLSTRDDSLCSGLTSGGGADPCCSLSDILGGA